MSEKTTELKPVLITDTKELDKQPEIKKIMKGLIAVKIAADELVTTNADQSKIVIINDDETQAKVIDIRARIKNGKKMITENLDFFIKPLKIITKDIEQRKKEFNAPLDEYEKLMAGGLIDRDNRLEKERAEKERKLEAEREKIRLKKEADEKKLADKIAAEQDEKKKEKLEEKLEEKQLTEPELPIEPEIDQTNVMTSGTNKTFTKKSWKAKVVDKPLLLKYIVKNNLMDYVEINMPPLNKIARDHKGEKEIPGVEFVSEKYLGK